VAPRAARSTEAPENKLVFETCGIVCLSLGAILLVALGAGPSGAVTSVLIHGLRSGFGIGAYAFPFALMLVGVLLLTRFDEAIKMRPAEAALPLVFVAVLTAAHLSVSAETRFDPDVMQARGGLVGAALAALLTTCFGLAGAYILVVGGGLVALAIATPGPVAAFAAPATAAAGRLASRTRSWLAIQTEARRRRRVARAGQPPKPRTRRVKTPRRARASEQTAHIDTQDREDEPPPPPTIPQWLLPTSGVFPEAQTGAAPTATAASDVPACLLNDDGQAIMPMQVPVKRKKTTSYKKPSMSSLEDPPPYDQERHAEEAAETIRLLEEALGSYGIGAKVVSIERGPSVARYEVQPDRGVRGASVSKLADDLARALAAIDVRVEPHVPGKSVIGIEVPNKTVALVTLKEVLECEEMRKSQSPLAFALGKDISGNCIMPKRVELALYDDIPHLIAPVVYDAKEAAGLLRQAIAEMEERYRILAAAGVRNIAEYNMRADKINEEKLFYLVIVVDELADLMMQAAAEFEYSICRIAQLARAVGIHLIVATQRPSVNVVTGTIKANIPSRVAFAVSSQTDSRVILDCVGAERLIGRGDMLYLPIDASKPRRIQGAYTTVDEINRVVKHLHKQGEPELLMEPIPIETSGRSYGGGPGQESAGNDEDLVSKIVDFVCTQKQMSTSMLQRKFRIGYNRAARTMDLLEERGIVGPADGAKPRKVLPNGAPSAIGVEQDADCEMAGVGTGV